MFILPGQYSVFCFCILLGMAISDELVSYFRVWTMQIYGFVQTIRTSNSCGLSLDFAMQIATIGGKFSIFWKKQDFIFWVMHIPVPCSPHYVYIYICIYPLNPTTISRTKPPSNIWFLPSCKRLYRCRVYPPFCRSVSRALWVFHGFSMGFPWVFPGFSMGFPWVPHGLTSCGCRVQGNVAARLQRLPPGCRSCCLPIWNWAGGF